MKRILRGRMNALDFINSKDIRAHLEKIDYEFSSLETAWLIYQCNKKTIEEKHLAWQELIDTMPDCKVEHNNISVPSLHAFLMKYMELEDKLVKDFSGANYKLDSDEDPFVYDIIYEYKGGDAFDWGIFSSDDALFETALEPDEDVVRIKIIKTRVNYDMGSENAYLSPDFSFMSIEPCLIGEEYETFYDFFEWLWFDFPTPFKKGDIIWDPSSKEDRFCQGPFVNTGVGLDGLSDKAKNHMPKYGDNTDMIATGYFLSPEGDIYHECMHSYMNLEYYDKELTGKKRVLKALSNYLKGDIDVGLLVRAYHQIRMEEYAKDARPKDYTKEYLELAGIE